MARSLQEIEGVDELFDTPPEGFVKARNSLVKELKKNGAAEESAEIAKLKRPTGPVWAINQLARKHPEDVQRFLEIQSSLAEIGGGRRLNELAGERRKVVGRLTQLAGKLLKASGQTSTTQTLQRIGATLLAADEVDEQEAIRAGILTHELEVGGFGGMTFAETDPEEEDGDADEESERERAESELAELEAEAAQAAERADRLDEEAARLLQEADAAASEAREARKQVDRLEKQVKAARAKLKRR